MISNDRTGLAPRVAILVTVIAVLALAPAVNGQDVAELRFGSDGVELAPVVEHGTILLTVSGPDGFYHRAELGAGESPFVSIFDAAGEVLPDGVYTYELTVRPAEVRRRPVADGTQGLGKSAPWEIPAASRVQSGVFSIRGGVLVDPGVQGPEPGAGAPGGNRLATRDHVILDDLIVDGSACIGFDCVNGESFGFDTLRLKENNLRIHFDDTSTVASYPRNDWRLVANDSANGGLSKFSIEDSTGGRTPMTIEAGARSNSLYVDDGGRLGLRTSTPAVELHIKDGDTPSVRLEQDGSSGFAPQTWDVAGNETNFFIRDATSGSTLPFRIFPGADSNSLFIASDNDVGVGTSSPDASLDVERSSEPTLRLTDTGGEAWDLQVTTGGNLTFAAAGTTTNFLLNNNGRVTINSDTASAITFDLANDGDLTIAGDYYSATCTSSPCAPDYVFEPDYALMPLAELEAYVRVNRHLPNIPSADDLAEAGRLNVSRFQMQLLEKVEELTLYTLDQQKSILSQQERMVSQQEQIARLQDEKEELEERLARLEASVARNE
ncbi:MAG: hypothetical protein PVG07_04065 [Acidobacteriota bacterium]